MAARDTQPDGQGPCHNGHAEEKQTTKLPTKKRMSLAIVINKVDVSIMSFVTCESASSVPIQPKRPGPAQPADSIQQRAPLLESDEAATPLVAPLVEAASITGIQVASAA
jgi:hypothetical protein